MAVILPASAYQIVVFDGHVHSKYSDEGIFTKNTDILDIDRDLSDEFGSGSWANIGCAITDHSDVVLEVETEMFSKVIFRSILTTQEWIDRETDINNLVSAHLVIPGEEITMGNGTDVNTEGHFLAYGLNSVVTMPFVNPLGLEPDPDDPGDLLLPESVFDGNPPRKDVGDILSSINGFGYIAHPNTGEPWRDYSWDRATPHLGSKIKGMEILSMGKDQGVKTKTAWKEWEKILQQSKNFYVVGGSDYHGPKVGYGQMGSSFTYVLLADGDDPNDRGNLVRALRKGNTIASTGPFINLMVNNGVKQHLPGDTVITDKGSNVTVTVEWGNGTTYLPPYSSKVEIYECLARKAGGFKLARPAITIRDSIGAESFDYQVKENTFLMAKLIVNDPWSPPHTAYTSPIFLDPPGTERAIIDVALVIDCSGSMSSNDPSYKRKDAAKQFIDLVQTGDKIAVIGYNSDAYVFATLKEVNSQADRDS